MRNAAGGTIFLDEVHELSDEFQTFLLDIFDCEPIQRVAGKADSFIPNVRLLLATNKDLDQEVEAGRFKHDLLRRINQNHIVSNSSACLASRGRFLFVKAKFKDESKKEHFRVDMRVYSALLRHKWTGNVGELQGVLDKAKIKIAKGKQFTLDHLDLGDQGILIGQVGPMNDDEVEIDVLVMLAKSLQQQGFRQGQGLQRQMAELLGHSEAKMSRLVNKHELFTRL